MADPGDRATIWWPFPAGSEQMPAEKLCSTHRTARATPTTSSASTRLLDDEERLLRDTVRQFVARPHPARRRPTGSRRAPSPRSWPRRWARSGCSACTSRATGAPAPARSPTAWPASSSRPATAAPAASCRSRARWPCSRSGSSAPRSRSRSGCPAWPPARHRLLRPHRARLRQRPVEHAHHAPGATAATGSSTAPRCGSPTAASPTSPSCGPRDATDGDGPIRGFIVPTDTPGLLRQRHPPQDVAAGLGHLASWCSTTCGCPSSPRLPEVASMRGPLSCLNEARYGILWGAIGAGAGLLRGGARLRQGARAVRQADRRRSSSPSASSSR